MNNYYVLSTASQPKESYPYKSQIIGVEKVKVPKYLFKREIAVAKSSNHVIFLGGSAWAEDMDAGLTSRLKLFSTTFPTSMDAGSIVDAMDRAFAQLEEDVARGVREL